MRARDVFGTGDSRARLRRRGMLWTILTLGLVASLPPVPAPPVRAQGFGFGGEELKVVERFDKNGDGRLDDAERKPAREWLAGGGQNFGRRRFGFGGSGARGNATVAGRTLTPADVKAYPQAPLYDQSTLRTLFIQFEQADWEDELAAFYNTDVDVPATVTVDGQIYRDVGVHFRGASSFRMVPEGVKRSLNLAFDFVHDKQRLGGYRTLNLLNAQQRPDPRADRALLGDRAALHAGRRPTTCAW